VFILAAAAFTLIKISALYGVSARILFGVAGSFF
jgi:hypothetical protein